MNAGIPLINQAVGDISALTIGLRIKSYWRIALPMTAPISDGHPFPVG